MSTLMMRPVAMAGNGAGMVASRPPMAIADGGVYGGVRPTSYYDEGLPLAAFVADGDIYVPPLDEDIPVPPRDPSTPTIEVNERRATEVGPRGFDSTRRVQVGEALRWENTDMAEIGHKLGENVFARPIKAPDQVGDNVFAVEFCEFSIATLVDAFNRVVHSLGVYLDGFAGFGPLAIVTVKND